jgi:hypothetical protein
MQLQYEGWATKVWLSTSSDDDTWNIDSDPYYTIYMYGPCDTYGEVDDDDATASAIHNADVDGPKLLMDHHSSKIQLANLESKILELTGAASKARRHLEKISDECNNKNVCKVAGQSASALFATSFVLVFANAIVTIMTMNGGIDTKAKISAVLHGLVILLTAIAVGVFTIDCASAVFAEDQEDRENFYGADFEYTSEYTNGATFSCAIAAVVISVVLLVLRLVPLPAQVVMPVKEGEELVGKP